MVWQSSVFLCFITLYTGVHVGYGTNRSFFKFLKNVYFSFFKPESDRVVIVFFCSYLFILAALCSFASAEAEIR
jgi:hypothetical protein